MALCSYCGAPLAPGSAGVAASCPFCGAAVPAVKPEVEPVELRVVQVVVNPDAPPDLGRCPHCRRVFGSVKVGEVELHGCAGCGGIWLDNESAQRVLASPEAVFVDLSARAAKHAGTARPRDPRPPCPRCSAVLARTRFHEVDLDVCPEHGTWFDARELGWLVTSLQEAWREREREREEEASAGSVACAGCQKVVPRRTTHITEAGAVCVDCHAEAQQKAVSGAETPSAFSSSVLITLHRELFPAQR